MKVQIVNKSAYPTPAYATEKSAGMDLKANIEQPITLAPLLRRSLQKRSRRIFRWKSCMKMSIFLL